MSKLWPPAVALFIAATVLAGCSNPIKDAFTDPPPEALEFTAIKIHQEQRSGPPPVYYKGSLVAPFCVHNPNPGSVMAAYGYEMFRVDAQGNELTRIHEVTIGPKPIPGNSTWTTGFVGYPVTARDATGASFDFAIHLWHEISNSAPPLREDRWFNVAFVPFIGQTFHEEGSCEFIR